MITRSEPLATTVDYFEAVYADAQRDPTRVPWSSTQPSPALVNWLNAVAPSLIRCGSRVAIVGCGLGGDAREVIRRGYEVTAFDSSSTAVTWARDLDPGHPESYVQADLFDPPKRWVHRFDLVAEVSNLEFIAPHRRAKAFASLTKLMAPHGFLLVVCQGRDEPLAVDDGPPWSLTRQDLLALASDAGLVPDASICCFTDDQGVRRIRGLFRRA